MENLLENNDRCECGKCHKVQTEVIEVSKNASDKLHNFICSRPFNSVLIMTDSENYDAVKKLSRISEKNVDRLVIENCKALLYVAESISCKEADIVVAVGREELISVAKYYACSMEIPIIIYPLSNFADFTFSRFSRLYDGVEFNFYLANEPLAIFVSLSENPLNKYHTYYLSSKFIAEFDNEVRTLVFKEHICERFKDFFKATLSNYVDGKKIVSSLNEKNIWTLVRLGMGMSFFGETKRFFGADKAFCDLLQAKSIKADFLELETIALKLVINSYSMFLKNMPSKSDANLNRHINCLSRLLKISSAEVMRRMKDSQSLLLMSETEKDFVNFEPYFARMFNIKMSKIFKLHTSLSLSENILLKNNYTEPIVRECFATCQLFSKSQSLLSLVFGYGYMDKLIS